MPKPSNFNTIRYSSTIPNEVLEQLDIFRNELEKAYFSKVLLRITEHSKETIEIGIEIQSNFWLSESIHYYNNHNWLKEKNNHSIFKLQQLYNSYTKLRRNSPISIDISEFSLYLLDTSLIISKIANNSIVNQLENILSSLVTNIDNLIAASPSLELPTEIHLPLFYENKASLTNILEKSYFRLWGLYYESEEDPVIYDIDTNTIFKRDLFLVNHIDIMENL
tara:strand:+ start:2182 stop:2847 length:666 start_codon:yes stop_codon:yes gene_type:complete